MKIGDKVRFLSATGGGIVSGFQGKDIVLVQDEDGFDIPTPINEVVVIDTDDYNISKVHTDAVPGYKKKPVVEKNDDEDDFDDRPITFVAPPMERKGGDKVSAYIVFVPVNEKEISTTTFEMYLINDCNFYLHYNILFAEGSSWRAEHSGDIEPNTKLFLKEFGRENLNDMEHMAVQMLAYKTDKPFMLKPAVDVCIHIDTVKFYKLHTFVENDFFEQNALVYPVIENDVSKQAVLADPNVLRKQLFNKVREDKAPARKPGSEKSNDKKDGPEVLDLHASEVLETTAGMSAGDILNYQLDLFRKKLQENKNNHGKSIVFIHGKGEGVLRKAITDELRKHTKDYTFQDASFREYGFGATQVKIK